MTSVTTSKFRDSLKKLEPELRDIIEKAFAGEEISVVEGKKLMEVRNEDLDCVLQAADLLRRSKVGPIVTYVVNRNINFTNICTVRCRFCAYSEDPSSSNGFFLSIPEIEHKVKEAQDLGATEVCIQGGIAPTTNLEVYIQIIKAVKRQAPEIHIHGFSPMEIYTGAKRSGYTIKSALMALKEAGLDSIPGTAAEILIDDIRKTICPEKLDVESWIQVIKTAHNLGIPTSATILYGHIEKPEDRIKHLKIIRDIQYKTKGFTEFVPLAYINFNNVLELKSNINGYMDHLKIIAVARMFLSNFKNIQVSWVKLGPHLAQRGLISGANDFGGTLMEENISRSAGASHGQFLDVSRIRSLIKEINHTPIQRSTTYEYIQAIPSATSSN